ncbi:hypothetical protein DPV79_27105 [Burkholderia reimsis]|uniref:Uncharacterized protein n=1 Tax=Burkholderia reimsis TaxID=2234132 RepID=A0A365QNS6_9BURK|nr:hypothetical protein [Burkholderia reimsis]RBB35693.1 hypothetical protein DPV79_27105 [Burkholderia reimsis]
MATFKTTLQDGTQIEVKHEDVAKYAEARGLDEIAAGRYSKLFAFKLFLHETFDSLDPRFVLEELKSLEGQPNGALNTKPPSEFSQAPLKGLWHKHFFSDLFVEQNIATQMTPKKLTEVVNRVADPARSSVITKDMIRELVHEVTEGALLERESQNKLTGEWIVFAKHSGQNYYLTIAKHPAGRAAGDQAIFNEIESIAYEQFPFLNTP